MAEEKRFGISGAITLEYWNRATDWVLAALREVDLNSDLEDRQKTAEKIGKLEDVLKTAETVAEDYRKYWRKTEKWKKAALFLFLVFAAVGFVAAIVESSMGDLVFFSLVGLALGGSLYYFIVRKRIALVNYFSQSYYSLSDVILHIESVLEDMK